MSQWSPALTETVYDVENGAKCPSQSGGVKQRTGHEMMLLNLVLNMAMFPLD